MKAFGLEVNAREIKELFQDYGKDINSEGFEFAEFKQVMATRLHKRNSKLEIKRLFSLLDSEAKGFITIEDMKKICREIQEKISEDDLAEIIDEADSDKDGVLNFQDFYK